MFAFETDNTVHGAFGAPAKHCIFHKERGIKCNQRSCQRIW